MKQGYVGVAYTWGKRKETASINSSASASVSCSTPDCDKGALDVGTTPPKLDVAGDFNCGINTYVGSGGGVATDRSRTSKGYSRTGR